MSVLGACGECAESMSCAGLYGEGVGVYENPIELYDSIMVSWKFAYELHVPKQNCKSKSKLQKDRKILMSRKCCSK